VLEAAKHRHSCFLTLTYAPEFEPPGRSLSKVDYQKFMYRLRRRVSPVRVRYFVVGE